MERLHVIKPYGAQPREFMFEVILAELRAGENVRLAVRARRPWLQDDLARYANVPQFKTIEDVPRVKLTLQPSDVLGQRNPRY